MSEVDEREINKVLAEFIGWYWLDSNWIKLVGVHTGITDKLIFTRSLDVLVPVWERLEKECPDLDTIRFTSVTPTADYICWFSDFWQGEIIHHSEAKTIQLAAATATYKAIKALEGREL